MQGGIVQPLRAVLAASRRLAAIPTFPAEPRRHGVVDGRAHTLHHRRAHLACVSADGRQTTLIGNLEMQ